MMKNVLRFFLPLLLVTIYSSSAFSQSRILGGAVTDICDVPWQVSVWSGGTHRCGGTIISAEWVLTAAHCFCSGTGADQVLAGSSQNDNAGAGQLRNVVQTVCHPSWNGSTNNGFDIVLVRVDPPFDLTDPCVQAIGFASNDYCAFDQDDIAPGQDVLISGWGINDNPAADNLLLSATLPVINNTGTATNGANIPGTAIVFDDGGTTAAHRGDSGGPAVIFSNGLPIVVGISSFAGCNNRQCETVYTDVSQFGDWITDNTRIRPGSCRCLNVDIQVTHADCNTAPYGSFIVNPTVTCQGVTDEVVEIIWPDRQSGAVNGLQAVNLWHGGNYCFSLLTANGCCIERCISIENRCDCMDCNIVVDYVRNVTCNSLGSIKIEEMECDEGPSSFDYVWDDGFVGKRRTDLWPGTYCVTSLHHYDQSLCEQTCWTIVDECPPCSGCSIEVDWVRDATCEGLGGIKLEGVEDCDAGSGGGPYRYIWNDGFTSKRHEPLWPGTYTVRIISEASDCAITRSYTVGDECAPCTGCNISFEIQSHVTDERLGDIETDVECDNSSGIYPLTYQWYDYPDSYSVPGPGGTTQNPTLGPTHRHRSNLQPGRYCLTAYSSNSDCVIRKCVTIHDYRGVGGSRAAVATTEQKTGSNYVAFYPNPVSKIGRIEFTSSAREGSLGNVNIINYLGQVVQSNSVSLKEGRNNKSVDFSALDNGLYFITISTSDGNPIATKRVIKN